MMVVSVLIVITCMVFMKMITPSLREIMVFPFVNYKVTDPSVLIILTPSEMISLLDIVRL